MSILPSESNIRAAAFCNFLILASSVWGKLYRSALPKSKWDEINAWTIFSAADRVKYKHYLLNINSKLDSCLRKPVYNTIL